MTKIRHALADLYDEVLVPLAVAICIVLAITVVATSLSQDHKAKVVVHHNTAVEFPGGRHYRCTVTYGDPIVFSHCHPEATTQDDAP